MKDKRKHPRYDARLRCWCEGENVTFYARVGNLSLGGLFLRTSTPLEAGARARVRFGVKDVVEVEATATVMWNRNEGGDRPPGMGLRFDDANEEVLEAVRKIVAGELQRKDA